MRKTGDTGAHKSRGGQKEMSCNEKREGESKKKETAASVACFWRLLTLCIVFVMMQETCFKNTNW